MGLEYKEIIEIVGVEKANKLDWDCISVMKPDVIINWFLNKENDLTAEELNNELYQDIISDYYEMLEAELHPMFVPEDEWAYNLLNLRSAFDFKLFGKNFIKAHPEMLYTKDFYLAIKLYLKKMSISEYIKEYTNLREIPVEFIADSFKNEVEKKIFYFLSSYIGKEENLNFDYPIICIAFGPGLYNYEKYLKILETNPNIGAHQFLEQACTKRIKDQDFRTPNNEYIINYNKGKEKKYNFGQNINLDILYLIDELPQFEPIWSHVINYCIKKKEADTSILSETKESKEKLIKIVEKCNQIESENLQRLLMDYILDNYTLFSLTDAVSIMENSIKFEKKYSKTFTLLFSFLVKENINILKFFFTPELELKIDMLIQKCSVLESVEFKKVIIKNITKMMMLQDISEEKMDLLIDIAKKLEYSNSLELKRFKEVIYEQLLLTSFSIELFEKMESIFLKNNLPYIGKVFSVFKILHPNYDFDFSTSSTLSPQLKNFPSNLKNTNLWGENVWRDIIIFSDLVRAALGSNNKSLNDYLENLEMGNELFLNLVTDNLSCEKLNGSELELLRTYTSHLNTLYNNTMIGKKENNVLTGDILKDIEKLVQIFSFNGKLSYNLPDRIIKMYFHFAGFDTLKGVKAYRDKKLEQAEQRNRKFSFHDLKIEVGDFIRGIGKIDYLHNILQNGSLGAEFLGASVKWDGTPLDIDLSRILELKNNIGETITNTPSCCYGPIFFLLKNDERFVVTREKEGEDKNNAIFDPNKIEVFRTLKDNHYGIRTGFASSEINAIMMGEYDKRVGLEIALNGFYIPVYDFDGKIVFTSKDYDDLRNKMSGLSYYGETNYVFSEEIGLVEVDEILEEQEKEKSTLESYKEIIYKEVSKVLQNYGLLLRKSFSHDLSNGTVELIETGSTGRSTYVPGDIDFDFVMRLDRNILMDEKKLIKLKEDLLQVFHQKDTKDVLDGQFRLKEAYVDGIKESLKIDITFLQKTDQVDYTTDLVLKDYLNTIKRQDENKYKQIIGNIVIAKKVFKEAHCYKSSRSDATQGGLGGVGIENFVLQNGGSFVTAAKHFLEVAEGRSFEEFKTEYSLWNFGSNFLAVSREEYPHDNYINGMNELGYEKMKEALENYLDLLQYENYAFNR